MSEKSKVRKEFERLTERNDFSMATVVNMQMSIRTIGGGDHVGDIETQSSTDQFVWSSAKAALGWCMGGRAIDMARQLLSHPDELMEFKNGVVNGLEEYLYSLRKDFENIDREDNEKKNDDE